MKRQILLTSCLVCSLSLPVVAQQTVHLAAEVTGTAGLKRSLWQQANPLVFGMPLAVGDLIELLDAHAAVTVICADLSTQRITGDRFSSVRCPNESPSVTYQGSPIRPLRGLMGEYPRVLAPRTGKVLSPTPTFRWQAVDGAEDYTVQLKNAIFDELLWEREVSTTELPYPHKEEPLEPDGLYRLEVSTTVGVRRLSSHDENIPDLAFEVLLPDQAEVRKLRTGESKVQAFPIPESGKRYVLASLYASHGLYTEAMEHLRVVDEAPTTFAIQFLLGELYVSTQLPDEAEGHFTTALRLAQEQGDLEGQARTHNRLGQLVGVTRGNAAQAQSHHQKALDAYGQLGDEAGQAQTYHLLGELFRVKDRSLAKTHYEQALSLYQGLGDRYREEITAIKGILEGL